MTSPPPRSESPRTPQPRTETPVKSALKAGVNLKRPERPVVNVAAKETQVPRASTPAAPVTNVASAPSTSNTKYAPKDN
jgi:hypothetical protein